jgi:hypothetical protein
MNKRLVKKIVFLLMAALTLFMVAVTHVAAQEIPFYWDNINVTIDVQTNGDMLVTETQKYVFTGNYRNQRYRYIPLDKVAEIKDVTVEENNRTIASSTGIEKNQFWIRWEHELKPPESHTFVLKYRVVGGLQVNGQNTQVFWKAIWADRKSPIKASQVTVKLPDVLAGKVSSYNSLGIPTTVRQIDGQTFVFTAKQALPPQQELEVQITFPTGIIKLSRPSGPDSSGSGVIRDGSSEVGGFLGFILWAIVLIVITSPIWISVLLLITLFWLYRRYRKLCSSCKKLTLIRTTKVISRPTPRANGKEKIIRHCDNCGYHHEKIVVTTYTSPSSSSNSGSYGGSSDSGSYGGGGDSGGGGGGGGGGGDGGGGGGGG